MPHPDPAQAGSTALRLISMIAVVAFIALLAYGLLSEGTETTIDADLAEGEAPPAPAFELEILASGELPARLAPAVEPALADGRLSLAELRGTPFVLNL